MQVQITAHTRVLGETVAPDEIVDIPDSEAKTLFSVGKAVPYAAPATPAVEVIK
jgi:hypothetical protein